MTKGYKNLPPGKIITPQNSPVGKNSFPSPRNRVSKTRFLLPGGSYGSAGPGFFSKGQMTTYQQIKLEGDT
ncbi:hypothetical protein [[Phormidium] sp. ETS-05]|uniref:hypothetical protein n=1 Tax=[Phormidium] sp. ETS-05 TaxID=222819 RepID=UPI0018EECFAF|nr:hypothetical protein [[Phormidium] sp. ETS-05]